MDNNDARGLTSATTKAALAAGTTTTLTIGADVHYSIVGKAYKKASASNQATPTTDVITGAAFLPLAAKKGCVFLLGLNAAGDIKVAQGTIEDLDDAASGANSIFLRPSQFPASLPEDFCPMGYLVTKVGASGSTWTFGSSNLAGPPSNVLHTFVDVLQLPSRPQVS